MPKRILTLEGVSEITEEFKKLKFDLLHEHYTAVEIAELRKLLPNLLHVIRGRATMKLSSLAMPLRTPSTLDEQVIESKGEVEPRKESKRTT
jgi:hypothetical protein